MLPYKLGEGVYRRETHIASGHAERTRGEGIMGFTLAAADLKQARVIAEQGVKQVVNPYSGLYGTSFLIPETAASGAWIEITQK
jgi:hypothetical protein